MPDANLELLNFSVEALGKQWRELGAIGYADPRNTKAMFDSVVSALFDVQALMNDLIARTSTVSQVTSNRGPLGA